VEAKSGGAVRKPLVIFAHSDGYDRLHQVASMALTAAVTGREVVIVLFFWALHAVVTGRMDEPRFGGLDPELTGQTAARAATGNNPPPSEMLAMARATGRVRILACSASTQLMGLDPQQTPGVVDEVVGMSTILRVTLDGPNLIYI